MSEFQSYNGPIIDVWANWWDNNFFKQYPRLKDLYEKLGIEGRIVRVSSGVRTARPTSVWSTPTDERRRGREGSHSAGPRCAPSRRQPRRLRGFTENRRRQCPRPRCPGAGDVGSRAVYPRSRPPMRGTAGALSASQTVGWHLELRFGDGACALAVATPLMTSI